MSPGTRLARRTSSSTCKRSRQICASHRGLQHSAWVAVRAHPRVARLRRLDADGEPVVNVAKLKADNEALVSTVAQLRAELNVASESLFTMEGALQKKGAVHKAYKTRWVVMSQGQLRWVFQCVCPAFICSHAARSCSLTHVWFLCNLSPFLCSYYKNKTAYDRGALPLKGRSIVVAHYALVCPHPEGELAFALEPTQEAHDAFLAGTASTSPTRTFVFRAGSVAEHQQWIDALAPRTSHAEVIPADEASDDDEMPATPVEGNEHDESPAAGGVEVDGAEAGAAAGAGAGAGATAAAAAEAGTE